MPSKKPSKQQVLREIEDAILKEETAIPIYASHIKAAIFWSGLPADKQEKIKNGLEILLKDSRGHVYLLREVKKIYGKQIRKKPAK
jgi:hypothetical protein